MNTIRGRLILILLLTQAVLIPPLLYTITWLVEHAMSDIFVDDARSYSQVFAAELSSKGDLGDLDQVVDFLDAAILGGHCVYAALKLQGQVISSSVMSPDQIEEFRDDFSYGENDDLTYYVSVPITGVGAMAVLQLGFDESSVHTSVSSIRSAVLIALLAFLLFSILFTALVSSTIVNPLKWLQHASRTISSGDVSHELIPRSRLQEIRDLSHDLELMRKNLVGMADRLKEEMAERELAETERRGIEAFLRQAQRLESLGTLAGGVAHEFNNVLQPILLYTELALEELPSESETAANLRRVLELARRARGLSRQILTFGRREENAEFRVCDIRGVVQEAVTMIRALLPATVDIRTKMDSDVGRVNCDPAQIKQLVVNLCNNSFQALYKQDDYIEVLLHEVQIAKPIRVRDQTLEVGEYVVLQVADSGRGMDEETMQRLFEPFFTTREVGEGTGLGLSVVHGIVMQHGGAIDVDSDPGKGTRFRIHLPLADEAANAVRKLRERHEQDTGN